ncbi:MAG: hypothetical protein EOO74_01030 [Myxococcales bacterium]|nr:MAG: hypothetical protein EOO74_01030 [Myxococcales bacterium]
MTENEFRAFLMFAAILAAFIGLVNMLRPERRWLGAGGVLLSIGAMLYIGGFSMAVVAVACGLGVYALARDVAGRTGRRSA